MFRKKIRRIVHFPFTIKPFDSLLAGLMTHCKDGNVLRKLIPGNDEFKPGTFRNCTRHGISYRLDINDYQSWLIYFSFEADSSAKILEFVNQGDCVIDIGGNIGQTALSLSGKVGEKGKILSFEPYPRTAGQFKTNLQLNRTIGNIKLVELGLGDKPGSFTMYQDCVTNSGANRVSLNEGIELEGMQTINITTLDNYLSADPLPAINLLKIDVEGFEMRVLKGASKTIDAYKPRIFMEVNEKNLKSQGDSARDIFDYLKTFKYNIRDVDEDIVIENYQYLQNKHCDIYCWVD